MAEEVEQKLQAPVEQTETAVKVTKKGSNDIIQTPTITLEGSLEDGGNPLD